MKNKYTLQVEFITPQDMGEENVRHVMGQILNDISKTDRFIDARIVDDEISLDGGEGDELLDMLSRARGFDELESVIEELKNDDKN